MAARAGIHSLPPENGAIAPEIVLFFQEMLQAVCQDGGFWIQLVKGERPASAGW